MKKLKFQVTNYKVSIFPLYMLGEVTVRDFKKIFKVDASAFLVGEWKNRINRWAVDEEASSRTAEIMIKRICANHQFIKKAIKNIYFYCNKLIKFSEKFIKEDLKKKTDKELYKYYQEYGKRFKEMYVWAWIPNALEGQENILSEKLENYLSKKLNELGKEQLLGEYFSALTTSTKETMRQKEEKDLLEILKTKNKNKLIEIHAQQYCWIPFNYEGKPWDTNYFLKKLRGLIKKNINPKKEIDKIKKAKQALVEKQIRYIKELDIDKKHAYLFEIARELSHIKDYRKNILYKSYYHLDKLIQEIARRFKLTPIQVRHILASEMKKAILDRKYDGGKLNKRIKYSLIVISKKRTSIFTGRDAEKIKKLYTTEAKERIQAKEIIGQSACSGTAIGTVKIVQEIRDIAKIKKGDILVSDKTDPSLLSAMKKSGAIITNSGGITCHAAIVSRELNKPCIIGTKIATKVLKDGDFIEVDANKGIVKILKRK